MSAKVMGQVFDLDLPANEMLVLLALADHAEHDGTSVRPSVELVAWKIGLKERQTREILRRLRDRGVLVQTVPPRQHRPTEYRIALEAVIHKPPLIRDIQGCNPYHPENSDLQSDVSRGAVSRSRGAVATAPKPSLEPSIEPKTVATQKTRPGEKPLDPGFARAINLGRNRAPLHGFTEQELREEIATTISRLPNIIDAGVNAFHHTRDSIATAGGTLDESTWAQRRDLA